MKTKNTQRDFADIIFDEETFQTMKRLLLPFTHGIDEKAIDNVLRFAKASDVTIVALAIMSAPDQSYREQLRPEHVEQATDFLETIAARATMYGVAVEQHEAFTLDVPNMILTTLRETDSQGVLLIIKEQTACLLEPEAVTQLQQDLSVNFYNLYIPVQRKAKKKSAFGQLVAFLSV